MLRGLNSRQGCFPFGRQAYPGAPTPTVYGVKEFGV